MECVWGGGWGGGSLPWEPLGLETRRRRFLWPRAVSPALSGTRGRITAETL